MFLSVTGQDSAWGLGVVVLFLISHLQTPSWSDNSAPAVYLCTDAGMAMSLPIWSVGGHEEGLWPHLFMVLLSVKTQGLCYESVSPCITWGDTTDTSSVCSHWAAPHHSFWFSGTESQVSEVCVCVTVALNVLSVKRCQQRPAPSSKTIVSFPLDFTRIFFSGNGTLMVLSLKMTHYSHAMPESDCLMRSVQVSSSRDKVEHELNRWSGTMSVVMQTLNLHLKVHLSVWSTL